MHNEDHDKNDDPANKGAHSPSVPFLIENEVSDKERTKNLRRPVYKIVQTPSASSEEGTIIIVEFCAITTHELASRLFGR